jgi:hypothetical protein
MAGTLLHEIIRLSSGTNYDLTDEAIAQKLGVYNQLIFNKAGTLVDDSAISKKLATDCFPTGGN